MSSKFPKPGDIFEGIYEIERILGAGGFARIYKGVELGIGRDVALKLLRPPVRTDQSDTQRNKYLKTVTERFQREAVLLSKLKSPHTVTMFSYGQTDSGLLYMVLEFIDGETLTELRRSQERIAASRIVKILSQVLISLREAHAMGMLHRDLKPGNIMIYEHLGTPDQIKLLDFGIAKLIGDAATDSTNEDLTSDGTLIGTPRYMAPEQIQGLPVGPASDLYALGLVAYELCMGQRAIEGDSSIQIIGQQLAPESVVVPASSNLPKRLRAVINKMMEKDTKRRYNTATEILNDLQNPRLLDAMGVDELPSIEIALQSLETDDDDIELFAEGSSKKKGILVGGAVLFTIVLIGILVISLKGPEKKKKIVEKVPVVVEKAVKISITAKSDGKFVPAVITVNGVDKGWTPLEINAEEVKNSTIKAVYTHPETKEPLISYQDVSIPRDVSFEFEPRVALDLNVGGDIAVEEKKLEKSEVEKPKKPRKKWKKKKKEDVINVFPKKKDPIPIVKKKEVKKKKSPLIDEAEKIIPKKKKEKVKKRPLI